MNDNAISNRYEFVILYDVENGNPNGDPDAGNMPRIDPETGHGIVTDVCIKRKIRNHIDLTKGGSPGYDIYIKQGKVLNEQDERGISKADDVSKTDKDLRSQTFTQFMCEHFFDVRAFGAVMTRATDKNVKMHNTAGQVRGPVQLAFGRSVDPIVPREITITRVAVTKRDDVEKRDKANEMGRKHIVPYGLYRQEGFVSANLAKKVTGFSQDDMDLFWNAVVHMFDEDRSAARGKMTLRELIVFKHDSELGSAPAQKLFDLVSVTRKEGVDVPRRYDDYVVSVDSAALPQGVTLERRD